MLARQTLTPRLQSLIDLYCHFPPKKFKELHEAVYHIRKVFDLYHKDYKRNLKTLILQDICLPLAMGSHWMSATRFFQTSEDILRDTTIAVDETLEIVEAFPSENVFRFIRHASYLSADSCGLLEKILKRYYTDKIVLDKHALFTLAGKLKEFPLKKVSPSLLELLFRYAMESGRVSDVNWVFSQRWLSIPNMRQTKCPNDATDIINLSIFHNIQLYTSEVNYHIEKILEKYPERFTQIIEMAKKYDCMKKITGSSVYHEASLRHALKKHNWQKACSAFYSSVSIGSQLAPMSLCDLVTGMICDGRWQRATRILCTYLDVVPHIPLRSFSRVAKLFIRLGKHSIAYILLKNHSPLITDDYALANLLHFLSKDGEWEMLLSLYDKLQPKTNDEARYILCSPDTSWGQRTSLASTSIGYENILSNFTSKQWLAAIATYELMLDRSLLINYKILTKILLLCCKANRWEPAMAIYKKVHQVHSLHRSIDLYAGYMGNLHHCLYMHGKWELNVALLDNSVVFPTELSSNFCLTSVVSAEKWNLALQLINRMIQSSQKLSCVSINSIRSAQIRYKTLPQRDIYSKVLAALAYDDKSHES